MERDEEHIRLLSIFHYVVGGFAALFAMFPIFHLIIGLALILERGPVNSKGGSPPAFVGWIFVIFALTFIITGWIFAGFVITAGRFLARHKHHLFCLVIAGVECAFMPFGTILGVFTIVTLMQESVKELFSASAPIMQQHK
jgi:hypothetical protein